MIFDFLRAPKPLSEEDKLVKMILDLLEKFPDQWEPSSRIIDELFHKESGLKISFGHDLKITSPYYLVPNEKNSKLLKNKLKSVWNYVETSPKSRARNTSIKELQYALEPFTEDEQFTNKL